MRWSTAEFFTTALMSALSLAAISGGILAGAKKPFQPLMSIPGSPDFVQGRNIREGARALRAGDHERTHLALLDLRKNLRDRARDDVDVVAQKRVHGRHAALERHAHRLSLQQHLEDVFAADAGRRAAEAEAERLALRAFDELGQCARRIVGIDGERHAVARHKRDRRELVGRIAGILVIGLVDRQAVAGDEQRIAVRHRVCDRTRRDVGGRTGTILDHDLIAELLGEPLRDHPRDRVDAAARREADHEGDLAIGIVLRAGETRRKSSKSKGPNSKSRCERDQHTSIVNGPHVILPAQQRDLIVAQF